MRREFKPLEIYAKIQERLGDYVADSWASAGFDPTLGHRLGNLLPDRLLNSYRRNMGENDVPKRR